MNALFSTGVRFNPSLVAATAILLQLLCTTAVDAAQIHSERSLYRNILVTDEKGLRCLKFSVRKNQRNQSCFNLRHPKRMVFTYTRMMMVGLLLQPEPRRILVVGLGGGTLPMALAQIFPESYIDVIEIDAAVERVARDYFNYRPSDRTRVYIQDARVFGKRALRRSAGEQKKYDLVLLDAFNGDYIPEHLMTREYLQETKQLMSDKGVLVANTFSISRLYEHESATYRAVFGPFFNLKSSISSNRVIVATRGELPGRTQLKIQARKWKNQLKPYAVDLTEYTNQMSRKIDWAPRTRLLTDQYAPANLLNRE